MKQGSKRTYGTGSLLIERGSYYGQFRVSGRLVKRKLGAVRKPGAREGLTKAQAERRLRQLIEATDTAPPTERLTLAVAGERYVRHLELVMERKPCTTQDYRIILKNHLVPFFGTRAIDKLTADDVTAYLHRKARAGLARQSIVNQINFLHAIFKYSMKRGWGHDESGACRGPSAEQGPRPGRALHRNGRSGGATSSRARRCARRHRTGAVPDGRHDRPAARRVDRAPVA